MAAATQAGADQPRSIGRLQSAGAEAVSECQHVSIAKCCFKVGKRAECEAEAMRAAIKDCLDFAAMAIGHFVLHRLSGDIRGL
jgi:hypothetical protein